MKRSLAIAYTRRLLNKHGLKDWNIILNDRYSATLGCCLDDKKLISISQFLVDHSQWKVVKGIVLHEIAHALSPKSHGHTQTWRTVARLIGCREPITAKTDFDTLGAKYRKAIDRKMVEKLVK